jgi:hypothetical protein
LLSIALVEVPRSRGLIPLHLEDLLAVDADLGVEKLAVLLATGRLPGKPA